MSEENAVVASTGKGHHMVSVTHLPQRNTTILQTVPSSSFPDKERIGGAGSGPVPHLALHAQGSSPESYVADLLNGFGKSEYCRLKKCRFVVDHPFFFFEHRLLRQRNLLCRRVSHCLFLLLRVLLLHSVTVIGHLLSSS